MAKLHVRHMVGGRRATSRHEGLPLRVPGAARRADAVPRRRSAAAGTSASSTIAITAQTSARAGGVRGAGRRGGGVQGIPRRSRVSLSRRVRERRLSVVPTVIADCGCGDRHRRARKTLTAGGVAFDADGLASSSSPPISPVSTSASTPSTRANLSSGTKAGTKLQPGRGRVRLFRIGLSDSCRLRITSRRARPVTWQIEKREYGVWTPADQSATASRHSRRAHVERRQNRVFVTTR